MADSRPTSEHVWTVAEAKARLSELLRRAREKGPQRIGTRVQYVVIASGWGASPATDEGTRGATHRCARGPCRGGRFPP
jgi:hypothetical protein